MISFTLVYSSWLLLLSVVYLYLLS